MIKRNNDADSTAASRAIGERLRSARKAKGWTQPDLAEATGISQPEISKFERGQRRIYADDLALMAAALEVPAGWFIEDEEFVRDGVRALARQSQADAAWLIEAALAIMRKNGG